MKKLLLILFIPSLSFSQNCQEIKTDNDKFTGQIKSYSPSMYIQYLKIVEGIDTSYYLSLSTPGKTVNVLQKGVIIILKDSIKIELPNQEINVKYIPSTQYIIGYYQYSALIKLSRENINCLLLSDITAYRLYIYDAEVRKKHIDKFRQYLKCLVK